MYEIISGQPAVRMPVQAPHHERFPKHFLHSFQSGLFTITVGSRSLRKLIKYLARKRKFLLILGGLSELNSK